MASKVIDFESLGGVGDGNIITGSGTDNAAAFARAVDYGEQGYQVIFPAAKVFRTSRTIPVHEMDWKGDMANPPIIFGWFANRGNPIIGRSRSPERKHASISGIRFHRCGPNPEHGIIVDNMASFDFDGWVTAIYAADGHVRGGAIGVSPFQPAHRPSSHVNVKARISNAANFGVQFGNVSDASVQVFAENCIREVIGIEPYCLGVLDFNTVDVSGDSITLHKHGLAPGHPLIYVPLTADEPITGLPVANYWFAVVDDENTIRLAASERDAASGNVVRLGEVPAGLHRVYICGVAERIAFLPSRINNINPPTQNVTRSLDGVVVLTATSGGYVRDIDTGHVTISDIDNRAAGYCVTLLGLWNIKISGFSLTGGRIGGIRVGRGTLGGLRGADGSPINPPKITRLLPRGISVEDNRITGFPVHGINVLDSEATILGNVISTRSKTATGISIPQRSGKAAHSGTANKVSVPNGEAYGSPQPGQRD